MDSAERKHIGGKVEFCGFAPANFTRKRRRKKGRSSNKEKERERRREKERQRERERERERERKRVIEERVRKPAANKKAL